MSLQCSYGSRQPRIWTSNHARPSTAASHYPCSPGFCKPDEVACPNPAIKTKYACYKIADKWFQRCHWAIRGVIFLLKPDSVRQSVALSITSGGIPGTWGTNDPFRKRRGGLCSLSVVKNKVKMIRYLSCVVSPAYTAETQQRLGKIIMETPKTA